MCYFVYDINMLLTRRSRLNSRFKKRTRCHSFMALNRASGVPAADWLSQAHVKNYRCAHSWNIFSTLGEKFSISARPCNILYIFHQENCRYLCLQKRARSRESNKDSGLTGKRKKDCTPLPLQYKIKERLFSRFVFPQNTLGVERDSVPFQTHRSVIGERNNTWYNTNFPNPDNIRSCRSQGQAKTEVWENYRITQSWGYFVEAWRKMESSELWPVQEQTKIPVSSYCNLKPRFVTEKSDRNLIRSSWLVDTIGFGNWFPHSLINRFLTSVESPLNTSKASNEQS